MRLQHIAGEDVRYGFQFLRPEPGAELMEKGLIVEIKDKPGAVVITYRQAR